MSATVCGPLASASGIYHYRLYGLALAVDRPLPLLEPTETDAADVTVQFAAVEPPHATAVFQDQNFTIFADGTGMFTHPAASARMLMTLGRRISIDAAESVAEIDLLNMIIGPGMTMLFHQRGATPLHAAVVCLDGRAVALAGDSGSGKSSVSRALVARRHRLLSDDLALVDPETLLVQPGLASSKLTPSSASILGLSSPYRAADSKSFVPVSTAFAVGPARLAAIIILSARRPSISVAGARRLRVTEAPAYLDRLIARRAIAAALGRDRESFAWAIAMARQVPVFMLPNPHAASHLDRTCAIIEDTLVHLAESETP